MVTPGSENGRYFEKNRVNPKNLYVFKKKKKSLRDESNGTKHKGFDEIEILMSFSVFIEFTFRAYLALSEYICFS